MKLVVSFLLLVFSCSFLYADAQTDAKIERLEKSLFELQKIVKQFQEESDDIDNEITNLEQNALKMNGYINSYYVAYAGSAYVDKEDGFRIQRLSFIPHQQINEKLRWLSEIEFEDMPRLKSSGEGNLTKESTGELFVERAYIQYDVSTKLKFRVGRDFLFSTIFSDNHYPTFILNQYRPYLERQMFPSIMDGLELMGNFNFNRTSMDYVLYYGNGNVYKADADVNKQDLLGMRLRFAFPYFKLSRLSLAFADGYTSDTPIPSNNKKHSFAIGLEEKVGYASLTLQYAKSKITELETFNREGYYLRFSYTFDSLTPWIFYETYDASDKDLLVMRERASIGIEYALSKEYKLRLEHYHSYDIGSEETLLAFALNF